MTITTRATGRPESPQGRQAALPRLLAAIAITVGLLTVDVFRGAEGASAVDYPSWDDVIAARSSESAKQAEVENIQSLIGQLQAEVEAAQAFAAQKADEYSDAQDAYDTAAFRADELGAQAAEATERAAVTNQQAGRLISQLTRAGGTDLTLNLIVAGEASDDLLYQLGAMSQLGQSTTRLYEQAAQDSNTAAALTDQADIARAELEQLKLAAERAFEEAVAAQEQVEAALAEQQAQNIVLEEQLKVLTAATATTEVEYQKGVEERRRAEEAARAAAAAAAAARAAEAAKAGGYENLGPSQSGWSSPLPGAIVSDEFGMRFHPIDRVNRLHAGIDLVRGGGTCGTPVYAAAAGSVIQASYNGGLGNSVTIAHGGGVTTVYGHNSSLNVGRGQNVGEGELIAFAGTTGSSTGCHVHFETRVNGAAQNPRNFVAF